MTVNCSLTVSGISPKDSIRAFINSYQQSSKMSSYKKNENQLNEYYQEKMRDSFYDNNIDNDNLVDSFSLKVNDNNIEFQTTMPELANKYEYGSDDIYPRRYMEGPVIEVANQMSNNIMNEAFQLYNDNIRFSKTTTRYNF